MLFSGTINGVRTRLSIMTPDEYCQQKAAASGSSFYYSFLFLPPERRRAITALYAFCREVDDVVDECSDAQIARTKLAWWRRKSAICSTAIQPPVTQAFSPSSAVRIGEAAERDHRRHGDGPDADALPRFAGLERYCYHVAGAVGLLAAGIFGYRNPRTLEYARTWAPPSSSPTSSATSARMRARTASTCRWTTQAFRVPAPEILSQVFGELQQADGVPAERAKSSTTGRWPPAAEDRRSQRAGLIMAAIYRARCDESRARRLQGPHQRTSLTPLRKLWLAWKTWISA
jgi:phytoene synthase